MAPARIIAAVDFSPWSQRAADHAVALTRRFGGELVVLHVDTMPLLGMVAIEPMYLPPAWLEPMRRGHDAEVSASLDRERDRLQALAPELAIRSELRYGDPADLICTTARELDAELVVLATRGASASRFLLGSVAAHVAQRCPCPVVIEPRAEGVPSSEPRRILVGVDYSAFSRPAVDLGRRLLGAGGLIELVHIWHEPHAPLFRSHEARLQLEAEREHGERAELEDFAVECDLPPDLRTLWVASGNPAARLLDRAEESGADLVVLGAHGRHLQARLLGTVADRVLRHTRCALLIIPEAALATPAPRAVQGDSR